MQTNDGQSTSGAVRLGRNIFDPDRNILVTPEREVVLEPKIAGVLRLMISRAGDVVARQEFIDEIWQVDYGADESLTRAISQIRKALGDSRRPPVYIETIAKRGYRYIGDVAPLEVVSDCVVIDEAIVEPSPIAAEIAPQRQLPTDPLVGDGEQSPQAFPSTTLASRRWVLVALFFGAIIVAFSATLFFSFDEKSAAQTITASPTSQAKRVAVIPFAPLTKGADDKYFAAGLTEEVLVTLGRAPELTMIARTSSFQFGDVDMPMQTIAEELDVDYVLRGTVRRTGVDMRITTQLLESGTNTVLWSHSYNRGIDDIFSVQQDIAGKVLAALEVVLDEATLTRMRVARITDVDAFIAYQKGVELYNHAHLGGSDLFNDLIEADRHFEKALELAPGFGAAWSYRVDLQYHLLMGPAIGSRRLDKEQADEAGKAMQRFLKAAHENATSDRERAQFDAERTLFSSNWSALKPKMERFLADPGCFGQSSVAEVAPIVIDPIYSENAAQAMMACDPLYPLGMYYGIPAAIWAGDAMTAQRRLEEYDLKFAQSFGLIRSHWIILKLMEDKPDEAGAMLNSLSWNIRRSGYMFLKAFLGEHANQTVVLAVPEDKKNDKDKEKNKNKGKVPGRFDSGQRALFSYALFGQREEANALAARIDETRVGPAVLLMATKHCFCGAPFDIEATPNFKARIDEAGFEWPPKTVLEFPEKDW